mmetsp:Transcript_56594/g.177757  ORF Transcript_56594/g.177757 Transcript_56594/m.177757 type:complete len:222 (-) Transcript_56594:313-978(-)
MLSRSEPSRSSTSWHSFVPSGPQPPMCQLSPPSSLNITWLLSLKSRQQTPTGPPQPLVLTWSQGTTMRPACSRQRSCTARPGPVAYHVQSEREAWAPMSRGVRQLTPPSSLTVAKTRRGGAALHQTAGSDAPASVTVNVKRTRCRCSSQQAQGFPTVAPGRPTASPDATTVRGPHEAPPSVLRRSTRSMRPQSSLLAPLPSASASTTSRSAPPSCSSAGIR